MLELEVMGMTCMGCVQSVQRVVSRVDGVESVDVTLETGRVEVKGHPDRDQVVAAIERAGFSVKEIA